MNVECIKHYENGIKFDILAGSSIGAINASIITAAQDSYSNAAKSLESFWYSLSKNVIPRGFNFEIPYISFDKKMALWASMQSLFFGNSKAFLPKWFSLRSPFYFDPYSWTYFYDLTPLRKTLKEFVEFKSLKKITSDKDDNKYDENKSKSARLIITTTDIQKEEPVIFDNAHMSIDVDMITACARYPFFGLKWSIINGRYLWDGSLLTNTPMMDVMRTSPLKNKKFYIVDVFPRPQEESLLI